MEEILSNGRVYLAKVWAERLKWGLERMVLKETFCCAIIEVYWRQRRVDGSSPQVVPVLYPATHVGYRSPVGCSRPITSPKHCQTVDGGWRRSTPGRCTHFGVLGHIGLDFSNLRQTILGRFQMEADGKDRDRTLIFSFCT